MWPFSAKKSHLIIRIQPIQRKRLLMWLLSSLRARVEQPRTGSGRGGREMRGTSESEGPRGALRRGACPRAPCPPLPTESGTGQSRPSPTPPHGSSSLVSGLPDYRPAVRGQHYSFLPSNVRIACGQFRRVHPFREHVASRNFSRGEGAEGEHAAPPRGPRQRVVLRPHSPA